MLLQASQCVKACESLGDIGGLIFTLAALAWGAWNAHQKARAVASATQAHVEKTAAISQAEVYKQLSLRPAPMPVIMSTPSMLAPNQSLIDPSMLEPDARAPESDTPTQRAKLGAKP